MERLVPAPQPPSAAVQEARRAFLRALKADLIAKEPQQTADPALNALLIAVRTETIRECREKVAELRPHYDGIFPYGRVAAKDVFAIFDALGGQP